MKKNKGTPPVEMIGKKFGLWYVAGNASKKTSSGILYYRCECECGNIREIQGSALRNRTSEGCRDCGGKKTGAKLIGRKSFNRLPDGEAQRNSLFSRYKKSAKRRNIIFNIDINFFEKITKEKCFYCGCIPSQKSKSLGLGGDYIYNGIDRVNNFVGYIKENCIPCCKFCNRAKDTLSQDIFFNKIYEIYKHSLGCTLKEKK